MPDLIPFQFDAHEIRVRLDSHGAPWWVAKDVCTTLAITDVSDAVKKLRPHEKDTAEIPTLGGPQHLLVINEAGLYRLIFRSNKPDAQRFQDWVFHEVLPTIRNTGTYAAPTVPPSLTTATPFELATRDLTAWLDAAKLFATPLHIAQQEGVKMIAAAHGVDFRPLLLAAPAQGQIPEAALMLEPSDLARLFGLKSGLAVNQALYALGWQRRLAVGWEPTADGAEYSARHAWTVGNKSGYNFRWNVAAVRRALHIRTDQGEA